MVYRYNISLKEEIKQIVIADLVLTTAFTLFLLGGIFDFSGKFIIEFLYFFPAMFIVVTLVFVLHELMHRQVAKKFGAVASFQYWSGTYNFYQIVFVFKSGFGGVIK